MIGPLLFAAVVIEAAPAQLPSAKDSDTVFACQYFRTDREASDGSVHVVDLRAVKHADATWTLEVGNHPAVKATSFSAEFGSVGGSLGLRWMSEDGKEKRAYLSFSDIVLPDGKQYFWLNFDRPSLWQAPGYGCESQGLNKPGAGA